MPVPATNPSLLDVYSEFGAPIGTPISSMLRGGAYVIDGEGTQTIPTALPVDLLDYAGTFVPAALSIDSVEAVSGGVVSSVVIDGMTASFLMTHTTRSGVQAVTATMVGRVNVRVERASTTRLAVTARASNPVVQGVFRQPYTGVTFPSFDDAEQFNTGTGPFVQDNAGTLQGFWQVRPPCGPIGFTEPQRIADSTPVTMAAVADGVYGVDFTLEHRLSAFIGIPVPAGSVLSHGAIGQIVMPLSMIFRDPGSGALVQETLMLVTIDTAGILQAQAVNSP